MSDELLRKIERHLNQTTWLLLLILVSIFTLTIVVLTHG